MSDITETYLAECERLASEAPTDVTWLTIEPIERFIAAAREAVPRLCAAVREARATSRQVSRDMSEECDTLRARVAELEAEQKRLEENEAALAEVALQGRDRIAELERQLAETVEFATAADAERDALKAEPARKVADAALARAVSEEKRRRDAMKNWQAMADENATLRAEVERLRVLAGEGRT